MKRFFESGYNYIQDVVLKPGTYVFWAYIKSEFGDTFTFALANEANEWEVFDVDVEMGQWSKVYEVFTITEKKVKLDLIHRYYDSEQPVFVFKPQLIKGNIPTDAGASPFDIDSIVDDLHDNIQGIADFTNDEFADRVLSASERISLKRDMEAVETIFQSLKGSYEKLIINPFVPEAVITDLTAKYNAVTSAKTNLFNVLNLIIAGDNIVTPEEITAKDDALLALNAALYNYNLAEKEIQNALGADYTQKISAIRDFTDNEFADRYLSETEKISLSHDLDSVQTLVDSVTSRFNEMLLNPFLTGADRDLLIEKYNALLDAWDWDEDLDPLKPNGLKTIILNIINDPDDLIDPAEMLEKDAALSAFNIALGEFSETEVYVSKITIDYAIEQATFWSINATSPVIYKDAKDAVTDGHHMPVTVKGQLHRGTQLQDGGYLTVTADADVEAVEASPSPVLIEPLDYDDKSLYTVKLYDSAAKTILLDTMTIPVVFRGANGKDAINITLSNEIDSVPASNDGVVSSYDNTGTDIRVFEGATELTYDGVGTNLGTFKVTSLGINLTVGQISTPILGILKCVIGNIANLTEDKGITQFVVSGRTLEGEAFSEVKEQTISKSKKGDTGADGDGILEVLDYYGLSLDSSILPTTWLTTVPTKGANEYLWNYERILYTDGTYDETEPRVIQGKDAVGIASIVNAYGYSTNYTDPPSLWYYLADLPAKQDGDVLWVRDDITYTNGTSNSTQGYPVRDGEHGKDAVAPIIIDGFWAFWDDTLQDYVKSSFSAVGDDGHSPYVDELTGTWFEWNGTAYEDTGITAKGEKGADGSGILEVVDWYAISTSGTTAPGTGWQTTMPSKPANYYLWNYEVITYTDGRTPTQTQKRVIQGKDARSIYDIKNAYAYSASDTVSPTSGWQYSIAALGAKPAGYFLWVREDIAYTDNPTNYISTIGYVVRDGEPGEPGEPGQPGDPGEDGKGVSSVVIWYYKSSSATTQTGGSWSTTKPDYSASFFLWTKVITTYTDNSTTETTPILDPDWHKVMAITDKFGVTIDGALIQAVMMLLREANSLDVTAGISGVRGTLKNNPSYWSGGTYAQAFALIEFLSKMSAGTTPSAGEYSNLAKIIMLHNGAGKYGDLIVEPSGRVVMVDPATGKSRLVFGVENIPTIATLLAGTVYSGSTAVGAGSTSTIVTLSGSTYVSQAGATAIFNGMSITISANGKSQAGGISSFATAELVAYRSGVKAFTLAAATVYFIDPAYQNSQQTTVVPPVNRYLPGAGTYTFRLEVVKEGDISSATATSTASNFAWSYTLQGVRRQQYGLDGMMFFYSDSHFHFTEDGALDARAPVNKWNAPGVLFSGTVNSTGGFANSWGAKKHASLNAAKQSTGTYAVYHNVGHTNYQVSITPASNRTFYVTSKNTNYFMVYFYTNASTPALSDTAFDFMITGNNYSQ